MCGICGIVDYRAGRKIDRALLERMRDTLAHRGPDDQGLYVKHSHRAAVGLGHRRLSVIDLATGRQPMFSEDGSLAIVFNGEIYNYQELTPWLRNRGHTIRTASDTEVIVHLYEELGEDCLARLNGMFAFALWDERRECIFLARDRLGQKPLFYYHDGRRLIFASEIKAIVEEGTVPREVDCEALHHFLSLSYMPGPKTMFRGIRKLLAGHCLKWDGDRLDLRQYWDFSYERPVHRRQEEYVEALLERLRVSVRRRLISDVPLGILLSGGIDSSTITALASDVSPGRIKTFSINFKEESYSEAPYARAVAERFGTDHHELTVEPNAAEILPKLVWHSDEPSADSSAIPTYYVSKMAREHVTVALGGDGGDELFAGYETYPAWAARRLYRMLPAAARHQIRHLAQALPVSAQKVSFEFKAKRFAAGAELDALRAHFWWNGAFGETEKRELYSDELCQELGRSDTRDIFSEHCRRQLRASELSRLFYVDGKLYLPDDILVKVDRMSMANSLEVRAPFLDHEVVECAAQIPQELKLRLMMRKKHILRKAALRFLPREIVNRKKQGFSIPIYTWLRNELRDMLTDLLSPSAVREMGYFRPRYVERLLQEQFEGRRNNSYHLWTLLVFSLWHRIFVSRSMRV